MRRMLPGVGVFGTGVAIRCFVHILKSCGFNVVALWGPTQEEAAELARTLGIPSSSQRVEDVLLHKDVDLVVISCSPHLQTPIAVKALGIGKHVLCGTPAGPTAKETLKMVHAARYYPRLMSITVHSLRFLPTVAKMRRFIDEGFLGEINICEVKVHCGSCLQDRFDWSCDELMGGGMLNTVGSDLIDIVHFLTQQKTTRVHGMLKTYTKQTEKICGIREITSDDFCVFQLELDKGACATVTVNSHVPGQFVQELMVVGTKGRLTARGADLYGQKSDKVKEDLLHFDPVNFKEEEKYGVVEKIRREIPTPYLKGMIRLVEAVREAFSKIEERQSWTPEPVESAATFEDLFYTQTAVDAIRLSSKTKEWVKVVAKSDELEQDVFLDTNSRKKTFSLQ